MESEEENETDFIERSPLVGKVETDTYSTRGISVVYVFVIL